jgi:hypothetical protein
VAGKTLNIQSGNHTFGNGPSSGSVAVNYWYDSQGALTALIWIAEWLLWLTQRRKDVLMIHNRSCARIKKG